MWTRGYQLKPVNFDNMYEKYDVEMWKVCNHLNIDGLSLKMPGEMWKSNCTRKKIMWKCGRSIQPNYY